MDHFFSAIEERENPELKGKPVVVGADPKEGKGRGVVKTCNYEARAFGIHSGMPISRAWSLCRNAAYVRANYQLYKKVSRAIMAILKRYSNKFQPWGLDEAFLDISSKAPDYEKAAMLATNVKYDILWNEKLACSIGISANKLVAKIASDFGKPDGLTVVSQDNIESFLAPMPVRRMPWIGRKTEGKLNKIGIRTIGDLASSDISLLAGKLGVKGRRFHQWARGVYPSDVGNKKRMRKSIGHQSTLAIDTANQSEILGRIDNLCQRINEKTIEKRMLFKTITVKIRFSDFQTFTHRKTLRLFTNRYQELRKAAWELARDYFFENRRIRLVGVRVSNLKPSKGQKNLNSWSPGHASVSTPASKMHARKP
jgi:DNA polymerase IV (DinB-like DNA polymerase)